MDYETYARVMLVPATWAIIRFFSVYLRAEWPPAASASGPHTVTVQHTHTHGVRPVGVERITYLNPPYLSYLILGNQSLHISTCNKFAY